MTQSDRKIKVTAIPEADDIYRTLLRQKRWTFVVLIVLFILLFLGMIVFGVLYYLDESGSRDPLSATIFVPATVVVLGFMHLERRKARKQAEHLMRNSERTVYSFSAKELSAKSETGEMNWDWEKLHKVKETQTDFLFFSQNNLAIPVAKRFFENESDVGALRNILNDRLGRKASLLG